MHESTNDLDQKFMDVGERGVTLEEIEELGYKFYLDYIFVEGERTKIVDGSIVSKYPDCTKQVHCKGLVLGVRATTGTGQ